MSRAEQPHADDVPTVRSADTTPDPPPDRLPDLQPDLPPDGTAEPPAVTAADTPAEPYRDSTRPAVTSSGIVGRTRISGTWVAVVVAAVLLVFLLVFVLQNPAGVTVRFFGFEGTLPLGVAMLFSAIAGALLVALIGTARILQLRRRVRRIDR